MDKSEHNHAPNIGVVDARIAVNKIKSRVKKSDNTSSNIVAEGLLNLSASGVSAIPSTSALIRNVQRVRARINPTLKTPVNLEDLELTDIYKRTNNGDQFLMHDSGGNQRFLIFSTRKNLEFLCNCDAWFCDGTFMTVPVHFQQLYTIHGFKSGKYFALVYVLIPNSKTKMYVKVLECLKEIEPRINPVRIMIDFERSFIKAVSKCFSQAIIDGCHFHFCQCVWRTVQSNGLQIRYGSDSEFAIHVKMLLALAFVPVENVIESFETLIQTEYYIDNDDLESLVEYFETWVGKKARRGKRLEPIFALKMWNCYKLVIDDLPRTNNSCEGWHRAFSGRLRICHASIGLFINALKREQTLTEVAISQFEVGREIGTRKRRTYRDYDERLKVVVEDYYNRNIIDYLRSVALNINI